MKAEDPQKYMKEFMKAEDHFINADNNNKYFSQDFFNVHKPSNSKQKQPQTKQSTLKS